jgi:putative glutathione S-transferase
MISTSEATSEIASTGAFERQKNRFTMPFGNSENDKFWNNVFDDSAPQGFLPVEAGRYRLIVSSGCPWAHRQLIVLKLLGLEKLISIGRVGPRAEKGWEFSLDPDNKDPVLGIRYLPEAYLAADPEYTGRATVPAIVDVTTGKVVNNDYHRLTNYWETVWKPFHISGAPDLYPEALRAQIDALNKEIFLKLNNGVYRAGFAQSQTAYEEAYNDVFEELDKLDARLQGQRFLFGDKITDSDVRLYVTLARFDAAYYLVFKCNRNRLIDFPALWNYAKDLYQTPGFGETTDLETIKRGYQLGDFSQKNPTRIVSKGPDASIWNDPHNRALRYKNNKQ